MYTHVTAAVGAARGRELREIAERDRLGHQLRATGVRPSYRWSRRNR